MFGSYAFCCEINVAGQGRELIVLDPLADGSQFNKSYICFLFGVFDSYSHQYCRSNTCY